MNVRYATGFGVVQLVLVLSLITVIMAIGFSYIHALNRLVLRAHIEALYAVCRYMQQLAIITHTSQTVEFDTVAQTIRTSSGRSHTLSAPLEFGMIDGVRGPPSAPLRPITRSVTFEHECMTWQSDGTSNAGTIYLVDTQKQYMYALTSPVAEISCLRLYVYDDGWEQLV